ncbi:MAG: GDP-mannose 4,6-dehydratase [bacterium]|nr:GDP-mannose 4,6-dehydratase [bacterium]
MAKKNKVALITGIAGQDGSYLTDLLLKKNYEVHGLVRRSSVSNRERLNHIYDKTRLASGALLEYGRDMEKESNLSLHYGDLGDSSSLARLIEKIKPDEIYNLGAQSHVQISFDIPEYTGDVTGLGTVRLLEAIRESRAKTKLYQASSSEMYGNAAEIPQSETTRFHPRSPYGCAKVYAHNIAVNYREAYGLFICNGILFNHESPRRGENFVTRKIAKAVAEINVGKRDHFQLGNLAAKRDWGYAPEYVEAMWLMMQQKQPDDYVIATGETHSVKEFVDEAFRLIGVDNWKKYVKKDPRYYRPAEINLLIGDAGKAKKKLGWKPKVKFKELVKIMLAAECEKLGVKL